MTRESRGSDRNPNRRSPQRGQFYVQISFVILLLLTIACAVFVYQVSPLRDPAFQPNSGNAGSLVPWLQGVHERDWIRSATGLAGLWAVHVAVWLWYLSQTAPVLIDRQQQGISASRRGVRLVTSISIGLVTFAGLWLLFMGYLLAQWLVD